MANQIFRCASLSRCTVLDMDTCRYLRAPFESHIESMGCSHSNCRKIQSQQKYSCIEIRVGFCAQDEKIPIADPSIVSPTTPIQPLHKDFVSPSLNGKRAIKQQSIKLETPKMDFFTVLFITPMPWRERLLQNDRFVMVSIMSSPTVCRRCRNLVIRLDESKCLHH